MRRLFGLAFIWGWSFLFIKVAVQGMTPATVAGARIALGALVMLGWLRLRRVALPRAPRLWRHFAVMGVVASAVPFTLLSWAEERITSGLAAVLNASTPLFAALFAALLVGERLGAVPVGGLLLGFAGVGVAAGLGGRDLAHSSALGGLAAVAAAACYGSSFVYAQRHLRDVDPGVATAGQLIAGTLALLPFAVATSIDRGVQLTATRSIAIVLLGVFGTGVAYVINYRNIERLGATRATLVTYLIPVMAVVVGVVALDERFTARLVAGGSLIIVGMSLLRERVARRAGTVPPMAA